MKISRLWNATAATTGFLFAIVFAYGVIASLAPYADIEPTSTSEAIARAFVDGSNNLVTGNYVLLLAAFLMVVFVGYLRSAIGPGAERVWPAEVGFGGGLLTAAVLAVAALVGISQGLLDDYGSDVVVAKTLLVLGWGSISITIPGLAALTGGMSLMSLSYRTLPLWLGWLGAVTTVLLLTFWALGIIAALLWITATSVIFTIREVRAEESPEDDTSDE